MPGIFRLLPSLANLVPEEFSDGDRLWHQAAYLDDELFGPWAAEEMTRTGEVKPDLVRDMLRLRAINSRVAGLLYLRLFPDKPIPPDTLRGVIRWWAPHRTTRVAGGP